MQTKMSKTITKDFELKYLISTPDGFDKEKEKLPMIVFLHGAGERGDKCTEMLCHSIPKIFMSGHAAPCPDLRVITLCPQCPQDMIWDPLLLFVKELIDEVAEEYNVDQDRISLTGLSMGGFGSFQLAALFPERFSALAVCCGGGMEWRAPRVVDMPIRLYHGIVDSVVPVERTISLEKALKSFGNTPETFLYEGVDHDVWDIAYEQTDCIEWLASQVRK
ncbi:MAG: dienelactone hydrolase family protein [Clostridia bacterium]|nr:dienelactone hydrolase family protein [Clostridia bacterium]